MAPEPLFIRVYAESGNDIGGLLWTSQLRKWALFATFCDMKGRPQSKRIEIVWVEGRQRWCAKIPPFITKGKKRVKFFESESSAREWAAEREVESARGKTVQMDSEPAATFSVRLLVKKYLDDKEGEVSAGQLKLLKNHLGKLVDQYGSEHVDAIDPLECRKWLKVIEGAQRTRHGVFSTCRTLYRWALRYHFAKTSPFDRMEPIPKGEATKAVLEPAEMQMLLSMEMPHYLRAWLVLGGFCGLRPVEIFKSDWSCIDWTSEEIHITPDAIKRDKLRQRGIKERIVDMTPAALRLLPRGLSGPIIPVSGTTLQYQVCRLAVALAKMRGEQTREKKSWLHGKVTPIETASWPHDCLRHSAATYWLAELGDAWKVAQKLGHTTAKMVHDNYALPKSKTVAKEWWAIGDDGSLNPNFRLLRKEAA